jgi:hypothetical protein
MNLYEQLRAEARLQREIAVKRARAEYRESLKQIEALRLRLGSESPAPPGKRKRRSVIELVAEVMPRQRTFTFADIHRSLNAAEPNRKFNEMSLRTTLGQLAERGMVKRISRNQTGQVLWAAAGSTVEVCPLGSKPLADLAEAILRERGPMAQAALVVALQESGYRSDASPRRLLGALRAAVNRHPGRFTVGADGRWAVEAK